MKSLASINEKDLETIKMALNDSISDIITELKADLPEKKRLPLLQYKERYSRVFENLRQNSSIYALGESELDIVAGGLNDAIDLLNEHISDDLPDEEKQEILTYKDDCQRLVNLLAG